MSSKCMEGAEARDIIRRNIREAREEMLHKAKDSTEKLSEWATKNVRKLRNEKKGSKSKDKKCKKKKLKKVKNKSSNKKNHKTESTDSDTDSSSDSSDDNESKTVKKKLKMKKSKKRSSPHDDNGNKSTDSCRKAKSKHKKKSKKRKRSTTTSQSDDSGSEAEVWVEKPTLPQPPVQRESWMTEAVSFKTYIRERPDKKANETPTRIEYDPAKSSRELNPHWKLTGTGLPEKFKKPQDDNNQDLTKRNSAFGQRPSGTRNWQKSGTASEAVLSTYKGERDGRPTTESVGHEAVADTQREDEQHILLSHTDQQGNTRPLQQSHQAGYESRKDRRKEKRKRVNTHVDGERVRYFPDDDKYDIKQMFERERYTSSADFNMQFAKIASGHKNISDDLDDIFTDKIRDDIADGDANKKELAKAIREQERFTDVLNNCYRCVDSEKMDKNLIITLKEKSYLALTWHVGLQSGHCVITPIQHVSCSTQLDEDTWAEVTDMRKALTKMFAAEGKDVVFYEVANRLHRRPHLAIHCIPMPEKEAELMPFYFKKAIEESEHEWCVNKQLISMHRKDLRSCVPKGLPYFWVNFGMESGFAHVIEDENRFPNNFAQEIIGGLLQLEPNKWRRPKREANVAAKAKMFNECLKNFDCNA